MSSNKAYRIKFGSRQIEYQLQFENRKTLGIKVYPDCTVQVIAPRGADLEKVGIKVRGKAHWIIKQLDDFLSYHPLTPPRRYVNGETHLYLGRQYRLKIEQSRHGEVKLSRGKILVATNQKSVKRILQEWYRERALEFFGKVFKQQFPRFNKYQIKEPKLKVRAMLTRWGSCTPEGSVILNPELIKAPKICIEYVIIHELCHLVHHNHTKKFYRLQHQMMPDWEKAKQRLERALV